MSKPLPTSVCGIARTQIMSQLDILTQTGLRMLMIERVHQGVVFILVTILSPRWAKSRIPSHYPLQRLSTSLLVVVATNFCGCKNFSLIMVFIKSILPSTVIIPAPSTSLRDSTSLHSGACRRWYFHSWVYSHWWSEGWFVHQTSW